MKKLLTILFAVALGLNLSAQVPDYVPTDGLVAWYPFNGNGEDSSNNGNDLIQIGDPIWGEVEGRPFVDLPGDGEHFYHPLDSFPVAEEFSIAMWVRIDVQHGSGSVGSVAPIASKHYSGAAGSFILYDNNGTIGGYSHGWELGEWHHLTLTISSTSRNYYFDGALAGGIEDDSWSNTTYPFMIGGWLNQPWWSNNWSNSALSFDGGIGAVGVWGRVLTAAEVLTVFNESILGCTDSTACNFDSEATSDDGSCIPSGCMETDACNYNALAECEGEECVYSCCPGPGCCLEGTTWDADLGGCIPTESSCPQDLDFDGVVGVNDLMELLSSFGLMCEEPETGEFTCGDPMNYHGYDYATVQIGEQCWFAENLRTELYQNGDEIPLPISDEEWTMLEDTGYGGMAYPNESVGAFNEFGALYNWNAVIDNRQLCPQGWHIPSHLEWGQMEAFAGMEFSESLVWTYNYGNVGDAIKSAEWNCPAWNGQNVFGFSALPAGYRTNGGYDSFGSFGYWWSSSSLADLDWSSQEDHGVFRFVTESGSYWFNNTQASGSNIGISVRCLKDIE